MKNKDSKKPNSLALDGEISIYRAGELKYFLLSQLKDENELNLDLSGVTEIDTSGVQLLMMLKREAEKKGGKVTLSNHSSSVVNIFDAMNLVGQFGDPLLISSRN